MDGYSPYLGRIAGIEIQLHWSFLLLLLVILFLSLYYFLIWVLLFVCVLVHELVHSITSRRNGVDVKKIVLYPFGGGSIIDFEKVSPSMEFRIAIAGPLASLLLGVGFGMLTIIAPPGMLRYTLQLLFILNVSLGVLNILPWLPLDGGRALRGYLQKRMDFFNATKTAVRVSNALSIIFIAGTLIYAALAHGYSLSYREMIVLWDVVIAMFVYGGAQSEMRSAVIRKNIAGLSVRDALSRNFFMTKKNASLQELYRQMVRKHTHIAVFRDGDSFSIVSNSALKAAASGATANITVGAFGIKLHTISPRERLYTAMERMRMGDFGILAVIEGKKLTGVLLAQHVDSIVSLYLSHKGVKV